MTREETARAISNLRSLMRPREAVGDDDGSLDVEMIAHALAAVAFATHDRLGALERALKEPVPFVRPNTSGDTVTPAPGSKTWPVGSCPPAGADQIREDKHGRYLVKEAHGGRMVMTRRVDAVNDTCWTRADVERDPLVEPWTEPAATPDPRIAALEAERDALASQLATMAAEAIALRGERDAAVAKERADVVAWLEHQASQDYEGGERARESATRFAITGITDGAHVGASEK